MAGPVDASESVRGTDAFGGNGFDRSAPIWQRADARRAGGEAMDDRAKIPAETEGTEAQGGGEAPVADTWWAMLDAPMSAGGPVLWLLAGLSVVSVTLIVLKLIQFGRSGVWRMDRSSVADRLAAQIRALRAHDSLPAARIEAEAERIAAAEMIRLSSLMGTLGVIAMLSPLIGLFGTVLGMIDAFRAMEGAGPQVNPAVLSGGIWVALLTTAAGLAVAIPATAAHALLDSVLRRFAHALETVGARALAEAVAAHEDAPLDIGVHYPAEAAE